MSMTEDEVKDVLFNQLTAMVRTKKYAYVSSVDNRYSHLTDSGREFVADIIDMLIPHISHLEKEFMDNYAKQKMIEGLKND